MWWLARILATCPDGRPTTRCWKWGWVWRKFPPGSRVHRPKAPQQYGVWQPVREDQKIEIFLTHYKTVFFLCTYFLFFFLDVPQGRGEVQLSAGHVNIEDVGLQPATARPQAAGHHAEPAGQDRPGQAGAGRLGHLLHQAAGLPRVQGEEVQGAERDKPSWKHLHSLIRILLVSCTSGTWPSMRGWPGWTVTASRCPASILSWSRQTGCRRLAVRGRGRG